MNILSSIDAIALSDAPTRPDRILADRKAQILHDAQQLAHAQNLELIADDALADEVAGLVEWPVPLIGQFDKGFLDVPQEILISTMRANQKFDIAVSTAPLPGIGWESTTSKADSRSVVTISKCSASTA